MPDNKKTFHEFALKSILFKGQTDLYYCYLKMERLAHVFSVLQERSGVVREELHELVAQAANLPALVTHFAAGEVQGSVLLAEVFSVLSTIRILTTRGVLSKENATILIQEYEQLAEKVTAGSHPSPYLSREELEVPSLGVFETSGPLLSDAAVSLKDNKRQYKGQAETTASDRKSSILELVTKGDGVSIKEVSAGIRGCSEKTIQRELNALIKNGSIRKQGERRWSLYYPA